ncbi:MULTISPECIES: hypothetical protein [unclassified Arthrobacter]|uniref:hypothetical protein n=1 Tax=unclassified Arthrobacter TaxID=235627 RepID=UPI001D13E759|nr:hypothetical protein [Arthrobacter sp. zg-Y1110]MCC3302608.1 hypothetical protein [Arthrobacter sp. zg-Y895]MCQ1948263.1 hypothetical protein [Arthrobacter sp. zg-Y1116]MCQ1988080.1 hypothetical protein [Arthrobacter sp. zg-Y844]MCC3292307.1 hypothetical protein [Arthrobacter sp. zg-Y1110]UWX85387.1 hypothetical protein N2K99_02130 [Arthrobacter sp. zg-Y1110]
MSAESAEPYRGPEELANLALWEFVLTQLEDNLESFLEGQSLTEQAREVAADWEPPADLGPLPEELVTRARMLSKAQTRAYAQLRSESRTNRKQSLLIRSVPGPAASAVYLEVDG